MIAAISQDGFLNHKVDEHASDWTSKEDHSHYSEMLQKYKLQLMGVNTYEAYKDRIKLSLNHRRIIFTHTPEKYQAVPGKIEFTNESFSAVLAGLEADGFKHGLLLGGGSIFTQFLQQGLIDEAYITVEPLTFGEGVPFLPESMSMKDFKYLELDSSKTLNEQGTILLHYLHV